MAHAEGELLEYILGSLVNGNDLISGVPFGRYPSLPIKDIDILLFSSDHYASLPPTIKDVFRADLDLLIRLKVIRVNRVLSVLQRLPLVITVYCCNLPF